MGDALVVRDEYARALMFLEPWAMEWPITTLLAFLLVSSLTLNLFLLWKLQAPKPKVKTVYLTKHMSVYHTNPECEHLRYGSKALRECKVCAHNRTAGA